MSTFLSRDNVTRRGTPLLQTHAKPSHFAASLLQNHHISQRHCCNSRETITFRSIAVFFWPSARAHLVRASAPAHTRARIIAPWAQ